MTTNFFHFEVTGRGEFPWDMLRYDSCWPQTSDDVAKITPHYSDYSVRDDVGDHDHDILGRRTVKLVTTRHLKRDFPITPARWDSFTWTVTTHDK